MMTIQIGERVELDDRAYGSRTVGDLADATAVEGQRGTYTLLVSGNRFRSEGRLRKVVLGEPLSIHCPACGAKPNVACTTPTVAGRRPVRWFHIAREDAVR